MNYYVNNMKIDKNNRVWVYAIAIALIFYLAGNFTFQGIMWQMINRVVPLTALLTLIFVFIVNDKPNGLAGKALWANMRSAFRYSIAIVVGLELFNIARMMLLGRRAYIEGFEDKKKLYGEEGDSDADENGEDDDDDVGKFMNDFNLANLKKLKNSSQQNDDKKKKAVNDLLDEYVTSMSSINDLNDDETGLINDVDDDDDTLNFKKLKGKKKSAYTPAQAQRATYKLIDTVKQLEQTMNNLGPTLKMGHRVMKSMQKFGIQ